MVSSIHSVPAAVRACRRIVISTLALGFLAGAPGCGHRRVAMRPVFGTPVTASPVTVIPEQSCPTSSTMTTSPVSSEPFLNSTSATPSTPSSGVGVIRAGGGSPPAPDAAPGEPPLDPQELAPIKPTSTSRSSGATSLTRPSSLGRQSRTTSRTTRVSLRDQVKPYVENPEDLFAPPRADRPWKYVVLHHSANAEGSYDQIDRDHRKLLGFEGCGYHFVIGNGTGSPDGQIEVADRWLNQKNGVHCRNGKTPEVNEYGIGICLVGNFDQSAPTARQVAAARALVAYLGDRYVIPADHLGTHDQFATGATDCPGKNFPTDTILGTAPLAQR